MARGHTSSLANEETGATPAEISDLSLGVPYPNPATRIANVSYSVSVPGDYALDVFDMLGRRVRLVSSGAHATGTHEATIDVAGLSAGLYLVRIRGDGAPATQTLSVVR